MLGLRLRARSNVCAEQAGRPVGRPRSDAAPFDSAGPAGGGSPPDDRPPTATSLRVLFVTPYYKAYLGGIERSIEQLAAQLVARGHVVGVLTTDYEFPRRHRPGLPAYETIDDGVMLYRLPSWPHHPPPCFSVPLVWFPPRAIGDVVESFRPDVIHRMGDGWFWTHFWTWYYGRRSAGLVFTPSFHSLRPAYRWLQPINIVLTRLVDRIAVLSSLERRAVRRTCRAPNAFIDEVGWGVTIPMPELRAPRGLRADRLTVLCVGRLGDHKGQAWLLDRFVRVRARLRRPARLVLVGRDEGAEALLRERVYRDGLEDEVLLTGEIDDASCAAGTPPPTSSPSSPSTRRSGWSIWRRWPPAYRCSPMPSAPLLRWPTRARSWCPPSTHGLLRPPSSIS